MRHTALLACAVLALGLPHGAAAKGTTTVRACGPEDCVLIGDFSLAGQIVTVAEVVEKPASAPFYRLDITQETGQESQAFSDLFVPSSGLVAANSGAARSLLWYQPAGWATLDLRAALRDLAPFPAPASWPAAVETPASVPGPPTTDRRDWQPYGFAALMIVVALGGVALLARSLRVRRPRTA